MLSDLWRSLHAACSPNAPFAFFLWKYTDGVVTKLETSYFTCAQDLAYLVLLETQGYLDAIRLNEANNGTLPAQPWLDAFSCGKTGSCTMEQDFNLQNNVFWCNEMSKALYIACLTTKPYLFKTDYDKLNECVRSVLPGVDHALNKLYDPNFNPDPTIQLNTIAACRATAWNTTTNERPDLEPAQSNNLVQTLQQNALIKAAATTSTLTGDARKQVCQQNPNPTDDYIKTLLENSLKKKK